ncbi:MAG: hypothetical protein ABL998_17040, partial [Planctomycetota bacterium]
MSLLASFSSAQEVPPLLKELVLHARIRPRVELSLGEQRFTGLRMLGPRARLLWPSDPAAPLPCAREGEAVRTWLGAQADALGFTDFTLAFAGTGDFRGTEFFEYAFAHDGITLDRRRLRVYFQGERLLGLENEMPAPLGTIEGRKARVAGVEQVYVERRRGAEVDLVLATVTREEREHWTVVSTRVAGEAAEENFVPRGAPRLATTGEFREYVVPNANFPDQLGVDSKGVVWFSQPSLNRIVEFQPTTAVFRLHPTGPGSEPDGLFVDSQDRVWAGLYTGGSLGWWDPLRRGFHSFPAPYRPAQMAIPVEHSSGTFWVTDHQNNRISEFELATHTWKQSLPMPTSNCWVVQGAEDPKTGDLWFTEYNVNKLGVKRHGGPIQDVNVPGSGPAFLGIVGRKVYYSEWNAARLGSYDLETGLKREYTHPVSGETGGPLWPTPDGKIAVGTRNRGYILVFDPATELFDSFQIPTPNPGLKDGLFVDTKGT